MMGVSFNFKDKIATYSYVVLNSCEFLIGNIFYTGLLSINFFIYKIHCHVKMLLQLINTNDLSNVWIDCEISDEIDRMSRTYEKAFILCNELNESFNIQILLHFINMFGCIVVEFIYLFLVGIGIPEMDRDPFVENISRVMSIIYIATYFMEFIYFGNICESISLTTQKIYTTLNTVERSKIDQRLARSVSLMICSH